MCRFEGDFVKKYEAYVGHPETVNTDPEMAHIRKLEPIHDTLREHTPAACASWATT